MSRSLTTKQNKYLFFQIQVQQSGNVYFERSVCRTVSFEVDMEKQFL
jgi:hypothetical protein